MRGGLGKLIMNFDSSVVTPRIWDFHYFYSYPVKLPSLFTISAIDLVSTTLDQRAALPLLKVDFFHQIWRMPRSSNLLCILSTYATRCRRPDYCLSLQLRFYVGGYGVSVMPILKYSLFVHKCAWYVLRCRLLLHTPGM